jgi:hypothetical protein
MAKFQMNFRVLGLLALGGCSQIIGLSDYKIDDELDGAGGETLGGDGSGGSQAGSKNQGGEGPTDRGGEGPTDRGGQGPIHHGGQGAIDHGGAPSEGGEPAVGQAGQDGAAGAPSTTIDCDSAECCADEGGRAVGVELVKNGNFEGGRGAWTQYYVNNEDFLVLSDDSHIDAYSGTWYAWLGGVEDDIAELSSPEFTIPSGTGWLDLSGQRFLAFDTLEGTGDYAFVAIYEPGATNAEEIFASWDNYEYDDVDWTEFAVTDVPASHLVGNAYQLSVIGVTDLVFDGDPEDPEAQTASNFHFDDLSLKAYSCVRD